MNNLIDSEKILSDLLSDPYEFWDLIPHYGSDFNVVVDRVRENPDFAEKFKNYSSSDIIQLSQQFFYTINSTKEWLIKSKIRLKAFYYLGILGPSTSTEIAQKIERHPKSVSIYLKNFSKRKWIILTLDVDDRNKRYKLTKLGTSYYRVAEDAGWFDIVREENFNIEEVILEIDYGMGLSKDATRETGLEKEEYFPDIEVLIKKIIFIAEKLKEKLKLEINIPTIGKIGQRNDLITINSLNEVELGLIFAAINYLDKNMFEHRGNIYYPGVHRIKFIKADYYFNEKNPFSFEEEGFLSFEKTKEYFSKTLEKLRKNIKLD